MTNTQASSMPRVHGIFLQIDSRALHLGRMGIFVLLALLGTAAVRAQSQLAVDLSKSTGPILYGASGALYGQAKEGIPTQNMIAPLKMQVSSQKPEGGGSHPGGDILEVAPSFFSSGGLLLQDNPTDGTSYTSFGNLAAYTQYVQGEVSRMSADANSARYVYDPFNEGDLYGYSNNLSGFESDWKSVYAAIRSVNPKALIIGPSFSTYDSTMMRSFMTFAKANNVLPDRISWHELRSDFFSRYNSNYADYRSIETSLGISPLPIVINEYGEQSGDDGIPGRMIQFISRFEATKVYACLSYWTTAGTLGQLVALSQNNQATGAWWTFEWYGAMTGNTVAVTPPSTTAVGLQGVATLDSSKKQARVLFGGTSGTVNVAVQGLSAAPYFGSTVHATTWSVANSGSGVSAGPSVVQEADYAVSGGLFTVSVPNTVADAAYYLIVTPAKSLSPVNSTRYEAEYANLSGSATVPYDSVTGYSGTGYVNGYDETSSAHTEFIVTVPSSGFYTVNLRYSALNVSTLALTLNGRPLFTPDLPATGSASTWASLPISVFLPAGINRVDFNAVANGSSAGVALDSIDVQSGSGTVTTYQASASGNTLAGNVRAISDSNAPGGTVINFIGGGSANYLQFNTVSVPSAGSYRMVVTYVNNEVYNNGSKDPIFRFAEISLNGAASTKVYFNNTFSLSNYVQQVVDVNLQAGIKEVARFV